MKIGQQVLVHSIGPGGVYARVIEISAQSVKIKYYDPRDGGDIIRWVDMSEVAL